MADVASTSDYDRKMHAKLAAFMHDEGVDSEIDDNQSVETEVPELNVPNCLPESCLDHAIIACSDLKEGMKRFEELTGLKPTKFGSLRGVGTKSARVALDKNTFVEIIGPDPNNESVGIAPKLLKISQGKLVPYHFVVRAKPENVKVPENLGWEKDSVVMVYADAHEYAKSGYVNKWDLVFVYGHGIGGCVPEFVHWRENKCHPTARLPKTQGKMVSVQVKAPNGHYVHELLRNYKDVILSPGSPELIFSLDTPNGNVHFRGAKPEGIVMPGFGDDSHPTYSGKTM